MPTNPDRLLLCTDLDRTLIPNGSEPEHPEARRCFRKFSLLPEVCLIYVTGRHKQLVLEALADYELPEPDYAITDVGTCIYRVRTGDWRELPDWETQIATAWGGKSRQQLQQALDDLSELRIQEEERQSRFKLSYYLPLDVDLPRLLQEVNERLEQQKVAASLVYSVDDLKRIGLLDLLPRNATKLDGIRFLRQQQGYRQEQVLFAGDSGNDLPVLGSPYASVLVANASAEVKRQATQLAAQNSQSDKLYLAANNPFHLGGNYAAGILQGVWHFFPKFRPQLERMGFL